MAAARTITIANFIAQVDYELRNVAQKQFVAAEMLVYINKAYELIYQILVEMNNELVATGSGSFATVANTETYDLSANTMGDLWMPFKVDDSNDQEIYDVYLTDSDGTIYDQLPLIEYNERHDYVVIGSTSYTQPEGFYLFGDYMGLLPIPDAIYTVTLPKYIPNFVPASASTENMPFKNLFNQEIAEYVKLIAKGRNNDSINVEAQMMEIFQERALAITRGRRHKTLQLKPRVK